MGEQPLPHGCYRRRSVSSSGVRSAWRRIARSVPVGRSRLPWTGMTISGPPSGCAGSQVVVAAADVGRFIAGAP